MVKELEQMLLYFINQQAVQVDESADQTDDPVCVITASYFVIINCICTGGYIKLVFESSVNFIFDIWCLILPFHNKGSRIILIIRLLHFLLWLCSSHGMFLSKKLFSPPSEKIRCLLLRESRQEILEVLRDCISSSELQAVSRFLETLSLIFGLEVRSDSICDLLELPPKFFTDYFEKNPCRLRMKANSSMNSFKQIIEIICTSEKPYSVSLEDIEQHRIYLSIPQFFL